MAPVESLFDKNAKKVCYQELGYLVTIFLRLFQKSIDGLGQSFSRRLLSVMSLSVRRLPDIVDSLMRVYNVFAMKYLTDSVRFPSVMEFAANACNSRENAIAIFNQITNDRAGNEPLIKQYLDQLQRASNEAVVIKVSSEAKASMYLLKRFCKYLPGEKLNALIHRCCAGLRNDPALEFARFLAQFFENDTLAGYAAQCFEVVASYYPAIIADIVDDEGQFPKYSRVMSSNSRVATAFARIAHTFLAASFSVEPPISYPPLFVNFIVRQYLPVALFQKYEDSSNRWKTLTALLDTAHDLCLYDIQSCADIQNDIPLCRNIKSIIQQTGDIIAKPPQIVRKSTTVRQDRPPIVRVVQFDCAALSFLSLEFGRGRQSTKEHSFSCY
jgi:hypothetical protein